MLISKPGRNSSAIAATSGGANFSGMVHNAGLSISSESGSGLQSVNDRKKSAECKLAMTRSDTRGL